jgi:ketosteroid isomerase-like protein
MTAGDGSTIAEAEIRALIEEQAKAIRAKDVDGSVSSYAADVLFFDVVNPLRSTGSDAVRKRLAEWFSSFRGPIGYEVRDLAIGAGDDVILPQPEAGERDYETGQRLEMWWRATICFRKVDGARRVTHEHASVPFDVASGRASLDLEP